jgi:hypothetical protein
MGIKNFLMRKTLDSKMKDIPEAEREKVFGMIEKNPDFFQKVALEMQEEMKNGKSEMDAAMSVMQKYKDDLQKLT